MFFKCVFQAENINKSNYINKWINRRAKQRVIVLCFANQFYLFSFAKQKNSEKHTEPYKHVLRSTERRNVRAGTHANREPFQMHCLLCDFGISSTHDSISRSMLRIVQHSHYVLITNFQRMQNHFALFSLVKHIQGESQLNHQRLKSNRKRDKGTHVTRETSRITKCSFPPINYVLCKGTVVFCKCRVIISIWILYNLFTLLSRHKMLNGLGFL